MFKGNPDALIQNASQTKPFFPQSAFFPSLLANHVRLLQSGAWLWNSVFVCVHVCVKVCVCVCVWGVYWGICEAQISISVQWLSCETELPLCRVDKTWCPVFLFSTLQCGSCWFHWTLCCTYNNVAETIFWFRQWTQNNIFQNHLSSFFLQIT